MLSKITEKLNYKNINEIKKIILLSKEFIPYKNKIILYKEHFNKYNDLSYNAFEENKKLAKSLNVDGYIFKNE